MFHGDDSEQLIGECNAVCAKFIAEVANNNISDATCAELDRLVAYGCYLRQFISNKLLCESKALDTTVLFRDGTNTTVMKYMRYVDTGYSTYSQLYSYGRWDVLDIMKAPTHFVLDIIRHYIGKNLPISSDMKAFLFKSYGAEYIVAFIAQLNTEKIIGHLAENFPNNPEWTELNNLPGTLKTLDCSMCEILSSEKRDALLDALPAKLDKLYCTPSYVVTGESVRSAQSFIAESVGFKYLDQFADTNETRATVIKVFGDVDANCTLDNMKHFYPDLYSAVFEKVSSRYTVVV
jgi:hypothetical protein